uniref:IS30 family transposase n=1 Tax=Viridibacillus soli TaxID=2798301 RepID=UPI001F18D5E7|nr:IS30 family transposase [Viridibacillus soli]
MNIRNIDLPMKTRLNTKKKRSRKNKRVLGRSIEDRPAGINKREDFGRWEIDTVIGKKSKDSVLLTLTERKTRQEIIMKIAGKASEAVSKAINSFKKNVVRTFQKRSKQLLPTMDLDSTLKKKIRTSTLPTPIRPVSEGQMSAITG